MLFNNKIQSKNNSITEKGRGEFTTTSEEDDECVRSSSPSTVGAKSRSGFTILYAVVVVSVVLSLGVTIEGIFQRQSQLVGSSQESSEAFYAADTGLECAMYYDLQQDAFSGGDSSLTCSSYTANINGSGGSYDFELSDTSGADVCSSVQINKQDKEKGVETKIEARGYSTCGQSQRQAERALRTSYLEPYPAFSEAGTFTTSSTGWESIDLFADYETAPLVFATTQTLNGGEEDISAQVRGASVSGFEGRFCEYDGGDSCDSHTTETIGYITADADRINTFDNMEAGTVDMPSGTEVTANVSFSTNFSNTPYVYAMTQTDNSVGDPQALRVYSVDTNGFTVEYCDQSGTDSCEDHGSETVGYWAIDPSAADKRNLFDWGKVSNVADYTWENISFSQSYSQAPAVIAVVQGNGGGQQALYPQVQNVDANGAQIRFCESDNNEDCDTHNSNDMVWLSAPETLIYP